LEVEGRQLREGEGRRDENKNNFGGRRESPNVGEQCPERDADIRKGGLSPCRENRCVTGEKRELRSKGTEKSLHCLKTNRPMLRGQLTPKEERRGI